MVAAEGQKVRFKPVKIPVAFKGYGSGDAVEGIGFNIDLKTLNDDTEAAAADLFRWLASRHIRAVLVLGRRPEGETNREQTKLIATEIETKGEFDVGRLSLSHKNASGKLSAPLGSLDGDDLRKFSNRDGWLKITSVMEEIDTGDDDAEEKGDPDENDAQRPMLANGKKK